MGVLDRFERRIETLVEGAFAKAFRAHVQPVEIAKALERELDDRAAIVGQGRTLVPNSFRVELAATDAERLGSFSSLLADELATSAKEYAGEQRYRFVGPITVDFDTVDELDTGMFRVRSDVVPGAVFEPPADDSATAPRLEDEAAGTSFALTTPVVVIGRGAEADVRVEDAGVSRKHAELRQVDGHAHEITDLGSTNGTFVNGAQIARHRLEDGDRVELGGIVLVYRLAAG
jgi:sulfur carrier protein ThiS